jgi:predicted ATP-dependent endonuclease of OLD family
MIAKLRTFYIVVSIPLLIWLGGRTYWLQQYYNSGQRSAISGTLDNLDTARFQLEMINLEEGRPETISRQLQDARVYLEDAQQRYAYYNWSNAPNYLFFRIINIYQSHLDALAYAAERCDTLNSRQLQAVTTIQADLQLIQTRLSENVLLRAREDEIDAAIELLKAELQDQEAREALGGYRGQIPPPQAIWTKC